MKETVWNTMEKVSLFSLCLFLLAFPLSVSVSQIFAGLTIAAGLPALLFRKNGHDSEIASVRLFLLFLGIYVLAFVSSLANSETKSSASFFSTYVKRSEVGDFWMLFLLPISARIASSKTNRMVLKRWIFFSAYLLIATGCISLFSEVRLGKFVSNGFKYALGDRLQHYSGNVGPIQLYLPLGMMNTHLTYGGLLGLALPGLILEWFGTWNRKRNASFWLQTGAVAVGLFVLLLNQSRSIWLGVIFLFLCCLLHAHRSLRNRLPSVSKPGLWITAGLLIALLLSSAYILKDNWLIRRSVSQIFEIHNTENQRYYIYKNTLPIIRENFWFGVGGGNYSESHRRQSETMIEREEQLWYELSITPRGHAHNDLLHWTTVGGIFAGILFLIFWGRIFLTFFRKKLEERFETLSLRSIGILTLFPAGFFQCYLLDDEVVLPFFVFCGFFLAGNNADSTSSETKTPNETSANDPEPTSASFPQRFRNSAQTAFVLGIPLLLYWIFWIPRLNLEPLEVYNRRVRSTDPGLIREIQKNIIKFESDWNQKRTRDGSPLTPQQAELPIQIEGCLTHRYPDPPRPRTEPLTFRIYVPEGDRNPPTRAEVTVVERESFDQDQAYWAHAEREIKTTRFELKRGKNPIQPEDRLPQQNSPGFPVGVFFHDFRIRFTGYRNGENADVPRLYFGRMCDTELPLTR
ncbi:O-antigen ligase domain-containing protein [Leptospira gomenensis]|uniref:O-antigen ligase domain-containing protein n=1 Tax=Leptospira gomenensis TaxID=2484974 RepID=A0A5F1YZI8_9LEPT|nr:O-antigen ligase family protein [Leptospira gomenensis]TGK33713.1 O-antigen ligase domain-containing protein [Leptospira gomenensis]TGK35126.1 O-antigen ligase domain-containing protein [Leptospira gomenensis]TGK46352.1 O-antigen ligase domain-containing protein [Leptospira gomenensis]TGK65680.1 O-antigen ligase domain-containing protein [Leptospira gomenensis]